MCLKLPRTLQGRIVDVNEDEDIQKIVYDDEVVEWLSLCDERFQLLTPRAASAGCTTTFLVIPCWRLSTSKQY